MQNFRRDTLPAQDKIIEQSDTLALHLWRCLFELVGLWTWGGNSRTAIFPESRQEERSSIMI